MSSDIALDNADASPSETGRRDGEENARLSRYHWLYGIPFLPIAALWL